MSEIKRRRAAAFILALFASIGIPAGVPAIVFGAIFHLWVLMAFGILLSIVSFYSCPFLWIHFSVKNYLCHLAMKIEVDGVLSIDSLASLFNRNIAIMTNDVKELIQNRYISNYLLDEEKRMLYLHERKQDLVTFLCPSCGASICKNKTNKYICDYCHTTVHRNL